MKKKFNLKQKGFTIIELMITIFIFATMTTYLLAKYGTFNQSILLTNLAYDVALTIRTAQSYGLNVKSVATNPADSLSFSYPYGVHFDVSSAHNKSFIFFADQDLVTADQFGDGTYDSGDDDEEFPLDEKISAYTIKRGSYISGICVKNEEDEECTAADKLDVSFRRPDPDAIIIGEAEGSLSEWRYAEVNLSATDGSTKKIIVRSTGQIAITN